MERYYKIIEEALQVIGVDPQHARNAEEGQWSIFRDEIEVFVDLWSSGKESQWNYYFKEEDVPVLQVIAPITTLPVFDLDEFYEELLEINRHLFYATFVVNKEQNMLAVKYRSVGLELDVDEATQAIESVSYYAEYFQPRLIQKFRVQPV
ncbi:MAG: YbjN domain-containing protein [Bacteroidetes bacterium]|nr:MAG: YbjN domain-containing protein [Bacteroidota bacterium]